jgi:TRAP-type C4-dicarboxylate transport system permease small subunit
MQRQVEWLSDMCAWITRGVVLVTGILLIINLLVSVFFRYVVGYALSWPEELSMLLFTWIVLLTGSLGVKEGFHVRLTVLFSRLPPYGQRVLSGLITAFIVFFGAVLCYSGKEMVSRTLGNISATIGYPLELINSSAMVSGALIVVHGLRLLLWPTEKGS